MDDATDVDPWSDDETLLLQRRFGTSRNVELALLFDRDIAEIEAKAAELALAKNKATFVGLRKMPRWTAGELAHLRDVYPTTPNLTLAHELGRSIKSITSKASKLGLSKSRAHLENMGKENVSHRRPRPRALKQKSKS